ncbi:MAG: hypothetical protein ABGY15_06545 [bacterium]|nr:hypothetical protein [Planctomycetota bacterium]
MIAITSMVMILLVLAIFSIIAIGQPPRMVHEDGVVDGLDLYFHYYGWPDGMSLLVVDHMSLKQLKQGETLIIRSLGGGYNSSSQTLGAIPWGRRRYLSSKKNTISVRIRSPEGRRMVEVRISHEFDSQNPFFTRLNIEGRNLELFSDTIVFVDHQLDGSFTVNRIETDLTDLVGVAGEFEDVPPGTRGVPNRDDIRAYLLESSFILDLLGADKQQQK